MLYTDLNMWAKNKHASPGFTIVELLIVIVIIGILAAITIVAYNGIQERARASAASSALSQAAKKIAVWKVDNPNASPSSLAAAGVSDSGNVNYQYVQTDSGTGYCITATIQAVSYFISSSTSVASQGVCPGFNLLAWNKTQSGATAPIPGATVDTSVYRTSTASMRLGPGSTGQALQGNPYNGAAGQVYTVSFWIQTDSTWNGLSNNSKVRFGDSNNAIQAACGYGGAKTSWTFVTCSYTLTSTVTQINISVGNDGSIGNIWIDDFSLTRSG